MECGNGVTVEFKVPGIPVAKGRPRFAVKGKFVRAYTPAKTRNAELEFAAYAALNAPKTPISGPVAVEIAFYFPVPTSWPKWKREAALRGEYRHVEKPDWDNVGKLSSDSMNSLIYVDDCQICEITIRKRYAEEPYTHIILNSLPQAQKAL